MISVFYFLLDLIPGDPESPFALFCYRAAQVIANLLTKLWVSKKSGVHTGQGETVIVSLTSFTARIHSVSTTIKSLMRQSVKPDRIILWLAESQFPSEASLPSELLALKKRGLEIRFCEDLKPHKKYLYTMKENPDAIVITCDDDLIYPENTIERLLAKHRKYPDCVCCNRGHEILFDESGVLPYMKWRHQAVDFTEPTHLLCATGCGGVLYPPHCLDEEVFDIDAIRELALCADDLWLKVMEVKNGTRVVYTDHFPQRLFFVKNSQKEKLHAFNLEHDGNDEVWRKLDARYHINDMLR